MSDRGGFSINRKARFLIKRLNRLLKQRVRFAAAVVNRSQTQAAHFPEGTHHVKDDARLTRLIEIEVVARDDVEQIVRRETRGRAPSPDGRWPQNISVDRRTW